VRRNITRAESLSHTHSFTWIQSSCWSHPIRLPFEPQVLCLDLLLFLVASGTSSDPPLPVAPHFLRPPSDYIFCESGLVFALHLHALGTITDWRHLPYFWSRSGELVPVGGRTSSSPRRPRGRGCLRSSSISARIAAFSWVYSYLALIHGCRRLEYKLWIECVHRYTFSCSQT
jgi:hypothetical protein